MAAENMTHNVAAANEATVRIFRFRRSTSSTRKLDGT
jgi:hypothetical protein